MHIFNHTFDVRASLADVAEFHHSPQALKRLTPPLVPLSLQRAEPLAEGSIAEFTLWLGPLPVRWRAEHSQVNFLHGFTDRQVQGPFDYWQHRHTFIEIEPELIRVQDFIEYKYGSDLLYGLVSRLMAAGLPGMFAYRAWQTKRQLEK